VVKKVFKKKPMGSFDLPIRLAGFRLSIHSEISFLPQSTQRMITFPKFRTLEKFRILLVQVFWLVLNWMQSFPPVGRLTLNLIFLSIPLVSCWFFQTRILHQRWGCVNLYFPGVEPPG
jgi:hypothetical protein